MNGRIRYQFARFVSCTSWYALLAVLALLSLANRLLADVPNTWYGDATLNDVHFVDDRHGVAVGDHGTIWHTSDAGINWKQIPSGTESHLHAVHFSDPKHGWIVGGAPLPYSQGTRGVVLQSSDGGNSWHVMPDQMLPLLTSVHFQDTRHGWAVGRGSNVFPSGLFETTDGGRTWRSLPGMQEDCFRKLAMLPNGELLLAGAGGNLSLADRGGIRQPTIQADPLRDMQAVVVAGSQEATAVGEGGLILRSTNAGSSWEIVTPDCLGRTLRQTNFYAVERLGKQVWIGGAPGSVLLHSSDGGEAFEIQNLPTTATLRGIYFRSESTGWAVGALGTILNTTDGGKTWSVQRQGGQRLALLGIVHDPEVIPFELISYHAGTQGFLTGMEVINRPTAKSGLPRLPLQDAVASSGGDIGHTAWQFPNEDTKLNLSGKAMIAGWDTANDGQGLQAVEAYLVRLIRQWRPSVVLTDHADPTGKQPLAYLVNQVVLSAVEKAGDIQAFPEHQSELGLQPWSVARVCSVMPDGERGSVKLNATQISPQLAMSLSEYAGVSRGIAFSELLEGPATVELKVLRSSSISEGRLSDIFSGISIPAGKEARRPPQQMPVVDLAALQRTAQKRRNMIEMINRAVQDEERGALVLGQMLRMSEDLPPQRSVEVLFHLAQQANQSGNLSLAADMHHQIVRKFPQSSLAPRSAAWLIGFYASNEIRFHERSSVEFATPTKQLEANTEEAEEEPAEIAPVSFNKPENYQRPLESSQQGNQLIAELNQAMPQMLSEPSVAFSLERLLAAEGHSRQGESYVRRLLNLSQDNPWSRKAQWELALGRGNVQVDAPNVQATYSEMKPILDGNLNDPIWQAGKPVDFQAGTISAENGAPRAAMMVAFDDDYLYLAIRCMKSKKFQYDAPSHEARPRDADLEASDRVRLYLDLDRDYATAYELTVDYRGMTADALAGNRTWDPQWFVAAKQDRTTWTIEAAIPLGELTGEIIRPGTSWGMAAQRVIVGEGTEAWPTSALYEMGPSEFGLLQFR
ncbi:YCF48-related protein [Blastopirellula marina]|uniref:Uncharacterized protein n=1 Tax=Blastopirellula marina TaxID=124 RepID=A0A2S8FMZ0_9BACT|nr:YCF48-related protein [Blastopirellula marina]PQO33556.1 hypothetical protein C5Y98_15045 [Blastopirellula marina]PTL43343.1 hypothetical protein C5Y97_15055 [Blastopirellula marina]